MSAMECDHVYTYRWCRSNYAALQQSSRVHVYAVKRLRNKTVEHNSSGDMKFHLLHPCGWKIFPLAINNRVFYFAAARICNHFVGQSIPIPLCLLFVNFHYFNFRTINSITLCRFNFVSIYIIKKLISRGCAYNIELQFIDESFMQWYKAQRFACVCHYIQYNEYDPLLMSSLELWRIVIATEKKLILLTPL